MEEDEGIFANKQFALQEDRVLPWERLPTEAEAGPSKQQHHPARHHHRSNAQPAARDEEEEDVCRVCRSGSSDGQLYWPCSCSGTMRFVHEACLAEWLVRSKKARCELCGSPFRYTKIFRPDMPEHLPWHLLLRRSLYTLGNTFLLILRAIIVIIAWLALLPYSTLWVLRFYLWSSDGVASFIRLAAGRRRTRTISPDFIRIPVAMNVTKAVRNLTVSVITNGKTSTYNVNGMSAVLEAVQATMQPISPNNAGNLAASMIGREVCPLPIDLDPWRQIFSYVVHDIFTGQILTSVVVVLFVVGSLLREWIVMHAPFAAAVPPPPAPVALLDNNLEETFAAIPDITQAQKDEIRALIGELGPEQPFGDEARREVEEVQQRAQDPPSEESESKWVDEPPSWFYDLVAEKTKENQKKWLQEQGLDGADVDGDDHDALSATVLKRAREREERRKRDFRAQRRAERKEKRGPSSQIASTSASASSADSSPFTFARPSPRRPLRYRNSVGGDDDVVPMEVDEAGESGSRRKGKRKASRDLDVEEPEEEEGAVSDDDADEWYSESGSSDAEEQSTVGQNPTVAIRDILAAHYPPAPPPVRYGADQPLPPLEPIDEVPPPLLPMDEDDAFADDVFEDFDGILEAVGMTGSLLGLVQNMGLTNLLIALSLGATVWAPLCLGKMLAAANAYKLFTKPLLAVRTVSDPIFDALFGTVFYLPKLLASLAGPHLCSRVLNPASKLCRRISPSTIPTLVNNATSTLNATLSNSTSLLNSTSTDLSTSIVASKPTPAFVLKTFFASIADHWERMTFDDDPTHRALCILLGYSAVLFCGVAYVKSTRNGYRESFDRAFREVLNQQFLFLKVALFVFVEIVIFPAACGVVLNLCTLPLFPDATIWTRLAFHSRAPLSSLFLTWGAGTAFMFSFSLAIDTIRDSVRKGLMWFIRDPASADLHPIREILERDSTTQARKIAISAVLYATVIFVTFGINILFLRYACGVLPLRWSYERPFSFPLDLLLFRFLLPFAIRVTNPPAQIHKLVTDWAKRTAHELRLSSYVFGARDPKEEGTHIRRTWRAKLMFRKALIDQFDEYASLTDTVSPRDVVFQKDGGFGRVPAVDNVRVSPGRVMVVRVTEAGKPLDETGARTIAQQIVEMATTRKDDKYEVVYLPPNFRTRLALFVYLLWFTGSVAALTAVVIPLVMGRCILGLLTEVQVHDVYSLSIGFSLAGVIFFAFRHRPTPSLAISLTQQKVRSIVSCLFSVGILLPILSSLFVSTYIFLPFTSLPLATSPSDSPLFAEINIPQSWATGTMIVSAAYHLFRYIPRTNPYRLSFDAAVESWAAGEYTDAMATLYRELVLPLVVCLAGATITPGAIVIAKSYAQEMEGTRFFAECRFIYSTFAICLILALLSSSCQGLVSRWLTRLREDEFMLEKRLQNWDSADQSVDSTAGSGREGVGAVEDLPVLLA